MTYLDTLPQDKVDAVLADAGERLEKVHGTTDRRFALWLDMVDAKMYRIAMLHHNDIADWTWRDAYEEGMRPIDAAREALLNDGFDR